jgi:ABC-type transporter Mla MlaB component
VANVVLSVPGPVMFATAPGILDELSRQTGAGPFTADLAGCVEFDSSLIGVLLELLRRAGPAADDCRFVNPDHNLRKLARLYGIDDLLFRPRPAPAASAASGAVSE